MLTDLKTKEIWFITGSQHLYGPETLKEVADHVDEMVDFLNKKEEIIIWTLCQGQLKKECELMKPKDDFCIEQESSFLSSTDIFHYCNISYIFLLLFLHLLCFYMYLIQFRLSYDQRKIP